MELHRSDMVDEQLCRPLHAACQLLDPHLCVWVACLRWSSTVSADIWIVFAQWRQ